MSPRARQELFARLPWALPLLVAAVPVGVVVFDIAAYDGFTPLDEFAREALFSKTGARSLAAAVFTGVLVALLGVAPGFLLASRPRGLRLVVGSLWLAGLALPPVFLGGVWSHVLGLGPSPARSDEGSLARWLALCFTWGMSLAPLGSLVVWLTLKQIPRAEMDSARIYLSVFRRWRVVLIPRLAGGLGLAFAGGSALAFTDAATPAHFGVTTSASRASFEFLSTLETAPAGITMLPPWIAAGVLVFLLAPRNAAGGRGQYQAYASKPALWLTLATVAFSFVVPAFALVQIAGESLALAELAAYLPEFANTLKYAGFGGLIAAVLALAAHSLDASSARRRGRGVLLGGGALLLMAPGMVIGYTCLILKLQIGAPQELWWWGGFLLMICAPWSIPLIVWTGGKSGSRAAVALGIPPARRFAASLREYALPVSGAAFMAGACGALREVEYFTAFGLPGGESLAARSAQLLHFGMRPQLGAQMFVQLVLALAWSLVAVWLIGRRRG